MAKQENYNNHFEIEMDVELEDHNNFNQKLHSMSLKKFQLLEINNCDNNNSLVVLGGDAQLANMNIDGNKTKTTKTTTTSKEKGKECV